jgi:hypothetical protein
MNQQLVLLDDNPNSDGEIKLNLDSDRSQSSNKVTVYERREVKINLKQNLKNEKKEEPVTEPKITPKLNNEKKTTTKDNIIKIIKVIVDSNSFISFMTLLTIIALFSNDIQVAWLPPYVDDAFDILQTLLLFFFTLEILLTSIASREYIGTFFFWLDVIATVSLIQDISFIFQPILNAGTKYFNLI